MPTWAPFRLQVYFNGHHWLARQLDKAAIMARVECTCNDVTFFKHYRTVGQRDGKEVFKLASLRKNIYSLANLRKLMNAAYRGFNLFLDKDFDVCRVLLRGEWCISGFKALDLL